MVVVVIVVVWPTASGSSPSAVTATLPIHRPGFQSFAKDFLLCPDVVLVSEALEGGDMPPVSPDMQFLPEPVQGQGAEIMHFGE